MNGRNVELGEVIVPSPELESSSEISSSDPTSIGEGANDDDHETLDQVTPFVIGMLLAQDSIVGIHIPSSISLPASLFTHSIIHHLVTN